MRVVAFFSTLLFATPALAASDSVYSKLDFTNAQVCKNLTPAPVEGEPNDSAVFECVGPGAIPVSFLEGDLRSFVSFGADGQNHCSRAQTFNGFNSTGDTIEWRRKDGVPVATILRWSVSYDPEDSVKQRQWLVVTKLEQNNSCHMAYVEGAYPKANEIAQRLVDGFAQDFSCAASRPIFIARIGIETDSIAADEGCLANR